METPGLYETFNELNSNKDLFLQCDINADRVREDSYIRSGRFWVLNQKTAKQSRYQDFSYLTPLNELPKFRNETLVPILKELIAEAA